MVGLLLIVLTGVVVCALCLSLFRSGDNATYSGAFFGVCPRETIESLQNASLRFCWQLNLAELQG